MSIQLSKLFRKYKENIEHARKEYEKQLQDFAELLKKEWEVCLRDHITSFRPILESPSLRLRLRDMAQRFFRITEPTVSFAAIDGSCDKIEGDRFVSVYGGAYVSRGVIEIAGREGKLTYRRAVERDISYVAFIPIPPELSPYTIEGSGEGRTLEALSDRELRELLVIHHRLMELAEIYAAYDLARATQEYPHLILLDRSLSGWLGNTSFVEFYRSVIGKKIRGEEIFEADLHFSLSHPLNSELGVPPASTWLPHNRLIAEAYWRRTREIAYDDVKEVVPENVFLKGGKAIRNLEIGEFDEDAMCVTLHEDPRMSWEKMERIFDKLCKALFEEKDWRALRCMKDGKEAHLTSRELQFFAGVGLRLLIERCWERPILLIGVIKDSSSSYFFRNFLGVIHLEKGLEPSPHIGPSLSDRTVLETLPYAVDDEVDAPWATLEFDSCFMTILPQQRNGRWIAAGYKLRGMEYTRPPRLFLRWLAQFLLTKTTASHVLFLDRLAYPRWDDSESSDINLQALGTELGPIKPMRFSRPSRLQQLSMLLLNILIRNHFPEALGYPDPLHKADLAATSFRKNVHRILRSSTIMDRANPLLQTFRTIRSRLRRVRGA
ncbi:MAG: hypothetical protein DRO36_05120 [Candidatus Hecatellales archaeon]|nr:MAG: hypothetical protein DRO36_05120 [Candidatus Hecatellales archaeon]